MARDGNVQPLETRDWSELIQKTVEDGSRVISAEMRLFEQNVRHLLDAQADRLIGALAVLAAIAYGAALILIGLIFLLNLWLPMWLACVAIGAATVLMGVIAYLALARRALTLAPAGVSEGTGKPIETLARQT